MSETDTTSRFDISLVAEANEVTTIDVEVKPGVIVAFPVIDDWPIEANELLMAGQLKQVLGMLLVDRPEDLEAFDGVTVRKLRKLLEHLAELSGVSPGEGSSSAPSSRSTGRK